MQRNQQPGDLKMRTKMKYLHTRKSQIIANTIAADVNFMQCNFHAIFRIEKFLLVDRQIVFQKKQMKNVYRKIGLIKMHEKYSK